MIVFFSLSLLSHLYADASALKNSDLISQAYTVVLLLN